MRKRVSLTIIATRPRQFASLLSEALRKKTIDAYGGAPSDGVNMSELTTGLPINLSDPSGDPSGVSGYALPARVKLPTDVFLRDGDTIFEKLTLSTDVYTASLPVEFYREVWFDGLLARHVDHYTLTAAKAVDPVAPLASDVSVTAKYVYAG